MKTKCFRYVYITLHTDKNTTKLLYQLMKKFTTLILLFAVLFMMCGTSISAQERRPIDSKHPMWLIHVDVWNKADPQKIIDLIPASIKPYVVMNLSLSCQYDKEQNVYKMPQNAVRTYKSWATICQHNGMWFTCQPASGGHTHIQDDDLETFEYFYKTYPNFLGWNYAEQFWGFDEPNDKSSSSQASRIALFAKLVPMAHKYGGFLTISFCGNIWSHPLNPVGMMKRNNNLLKACQQYPEAILWLYKYTTSSCFYNNESVTFSPFISGLAKNYGVRYDNCGYNGALDAILGEKHGKKYPVAAGIGTVMEQTCVNGGAVWDGPELIWTEDFQNLSNTTVNGYTRRNWGCFPGFKNAWLDMFQKIVDGEMYIPSREEVVERTKIVVVNNVSSGNDEQKYAAWGDLYNGLYKQTDPFNRGNGQWMDNFCYFKKTGRYGAIPVAIQLYDDLAKSIPVKVYKSSYTSRWTSQKKKVEEFNKYYPEVSTGDLYVNRLRNQLVTYTPYTYLNKKVNATGRIPLLYNTCDSLILTYGKLSSGLVREYADHITLYLNNYRNDTTTQVLDKIEVKGATAKPTYTFKKRVNATCNITEDWNEEEGTYILNVKHLGGIDLDITCAGNGTERLTDPLEVAALEMPKQPEEYRGPVIIEAEDMDFKSIKSCVTDPYGWYPTVRGHAGNGFADMGTSSSGALTYSYNCKEAGNYRIYVRYTTPTGKTGRMTINANGTRQTVQFPKTEFNEWNKVSVEANLKQGKNTITIMNSGALNSYIDNITIEPADYEAEKFAITLRDAEHGKVNVNATSAAEGETVSLEVVPDEGYKLAGWNIIHGSIIIHDDNTFIMPDDNVTLQPVFVDMTSVYNLDLGKALAGTIPEGWRAQQEDNAIHEYPNTFSSGARVFSGFTGHQGKAFYWRKGYAEFGRQTAYPLNLEPGMYRLTYAMAAWKSNPRYKAQILDSKSNIIAESSSTLASPNVDGNSAGNVTNSRNYTLEFRVETAGKYYIKFINASNTSALDEFLLLECRLNTMVDPTAIDITDAETEDSHIEIFSITGMRQPSFTKGVNIIRTQDGKTRKILVK